jgi:tetratricopeptide (TPR) repeat protein
MSRSPTLPASRVPAGSDLPVAAAIVGIALVAANLATGIAGLNYIGGLFVWRDVALVYGLAALPLAALAAGWLATMPIAMLRLLVPLAGLAAAVIFSIWPAGALPTEILSLIRGGAAWAGTCSFIILAQASLAVWSRQRGGQGSTEQPQERFAAARSSWLSAAIAGAVLIAVPWIYRTARTRDDLRRLEELVEQSRMGEALALAAAARELDPWAEHGGRPLAATIVELDRAVTEIATRASRPLVAQDNPEPYVARARDLAVLGQTELALAALQAAELNAAPGTKETPALWLLRGTIYESRGEWAAGMAAYERARSIATGQRQLTSPPTEGSTSFDSLAPLVQATSGVAFCQRKSGDYRAAAESYAELLTLAPTAETHFLLAQFYEDVQATALAQEHARQAIELDPAQFAARGQVLLDKLRTRHFGCWSVGTAR